MIWRVVAVLGVLLASVTGAPANDSAAEFGVGGLVMVKTDAITMLREDLTITPGWITVRYEFRNDGTEPVTLRVAFPLPDVPLDTYGGQMIGETKVSVYPFNPPNFVFFSVRADGEGIDPDIEVRAELPDGRSVLDELREIGGWSLVLRPRMFLNTGRSEVEASDVGPEVFRRLQALGALDPGGANDDGVGWARWKTRITYHWMQTFRPGVTVVEHRYQPLAGFFPFQVYERHWERDSSHRAVTEYCIDEAGRRVLETLRTPPDRPPGLQGWMTARTLAYVLTTGANWAGPIGTFHLVIDGAPAPHDWGKVQFASACADLALVRTGPARLEATAHNYMPTRDLRILMIGR